MYTATIKNGTTVFLVSFLTMEVD